MIMNRKYFYNFNNASLSVLLIFIDSKNDLHSNILQLLYTEMTDYQYEIRKPYRSLKA